MVQRVIKATVSGWAPWAIGAALSVSCAAILYFRRRSAVGTSQDDYEAWWQRRERARANGDQPPESYRTGSPQLFV
jgi:hypothetical protein